MDIKITRKQKIGVAIFLFIILIITSIIYFKNKSELPKDEIKKNRVLVQENINKVTSVKQEKEVKDNTSKLIKAYICGYVSKPGVYSLKEGDRLDDLVKISGGFTKEADQYSVNLAYQVKDQDYFRILSKDETKDNANVKNNNTFEAVSTNNTEINSENKESKKININTATKEELKELPRIGDALSQRIIDYREKDGGFKVVEDIKEVGGIGDKMFENIKDKIFVE